MTTHETFLRHRSEIERVLDVVCWRHRLSDVDRDDFRSACHLHLLERDGYVLRAFAGRSSFSTYLTTVISRFFLDWRNAQWGKWRPSAEARRKGPLAIRLDLLLTREGMSFEEAFETLRTNHGALETRAEIERLAASLPSRQSRRMVPVEDVTSDLEAQTRPPDAVLADSGAAQAADRAARLMADVLGDLPAEERLLLRWRFEDGVSVADVSRIAGLEPKPLYRRYDALLRRVRKALEERGLKPADVQDVLASRGFDLLADDPRKPIGVRRYDQAASDGAPSGREL